MGNLFSVKHACEHAGLSAVITSSHRDVLAADAVILPGVGAFGDAMNTLQDMDLVGAIKQVAASSKPLVGICLGMQVLMDESFEFGHHRGLGIIPGTVVRLDNPVGPNGILKVPHVSWSRLNHPARGNNHWDKTFLKGLPDGVFMYFVHSFCVRTEDETVVLATTRYGHIEFCSALQYRNIFACQCHPERSGVEGLRIYQNLARMLGKS